ncbi:hypothetical protein B9G98_04010 [Wickerhamiella sorbophila]|uniref:Uncharacterized protein n=1 Tax=Wickerhamiella sorbophila TaxID=45607 RepID=A0A2T0FN35_9ASCO|nr:hypothetical protein B9G98_04010 [Wickerhamiella sorbophila]PRT56390.1 hypothetical protein B9G98_04010 [Wickerhamiella sorbophila]
MPKKKLVQAIEAAHYVVENETDIAVGQIELLERLTHNAIGQCSDFAEDIRPAVAVVGGYAAAKEQMIEAETHLDTLESTIASLEHLVEELDQWSTELQVKIDRLQDSTRHRPI